MKEAIDEARRTMNLNYGRPFGETIVKDGKIICVASKHCFKR